MIYNSKTSIGFLNTDLDSKFKLELKIKPCGLGSRIRDVEAF
jgi:hypothetical protein